MSSTTGYKKIVAGRTSSNFILSQTTFLLIAFRTLKSFGLKFGFGVLVRVDSHSAVTINGHGQVCQLLLNVSLSFLEWPELTVPSGKGRVPFTVPLAAMGKSWLS